MIDTGIEYWNGRTVKITTDVEFDSRQNFEVSLYFKKYFHIPALGNVPHTGNKKHNNEDSTRYDHCYYNFDFVRILCI